MPKNEPSLLSKHSHQEKSRRLSCSEFDLILKPSYQTAAVTVSTSKKVAPRAVDRNRIKRIIKEAARRNKNLDTSLIFRIKKNIASLKSHDVEQLIKKILS